jgi:hypothetical protein
MIALLLTYNFKYQSRKLAYSVNLHGPVLVEYGESLDGPTLDFTGASALKGD